MPASVLVLLAITNCNNDKVSIYLLYPSERHMQRIGHLLQASMFLNYMWQKMRVAGAASR